MLYYLLYSLRGYIPPFRVFQYITFRTAAAYLTALTICLMLGPWLIRRLREFQIGQQIRSEGPSSHKSKAGTPTMGGILVLVGILVPALLWGNLRNLYLWIAWSATLAFGLVGFLDDYSKITRKQSLGMTGTSKLVFQTVIALGVCAALFQLSLRGLYSTRLSVPFFKNFTPELDLWHPLGLLPLPLTLFVVFVLVGASNTVNLTDGLDGLAAGCVIVAASALTILSYVTGHAKLADYLDLIHNPYASELPIFCGAMVGAATGFLWYNAHPAQVFMGDVGSLSLGGAIGTVAVLVKQELLLPMIGGVFVLEGISVILQVASFRFTGKRIFRMAPIHHHFELSGWTESQVVIRFWIAAIIFALFSLTTLKLR
jgi:phospho-N-acetylmuramoyl-pentapeptide-transferase